MIFIELNLDIMAKDKQNDLIISFEKTHSKNAFIK
jgi:hypothetical protein